MMDPKKLLKALLAPLCTNLEGGVSAQKTLFLVKFFQKVSKNAFFGLFFQNFASGAGNFTEAWSF